jgi:hypothetical protein
MTKINGDLIPIASGVANLGVNGNAAGAYDITSIAPFAHIHQNSGVFHDSETGQSGVLRYSQAAGAFQISIDGGRTFSNLSAGGVSSVGVIGDVDLTGAVDLATVASGFMTIQDTGDASPLVFSVDNQGLSGFWRFPAQGFNGRVVNALTDFNGTEVQGVVNVVGASGVVVDIIGQTMTITAGSTVPRSFAQTFASSASWSVAHNLNSLNVMVQTFDATASRFRIEPDDIQVVDANNVLISWNGAQAGLVVIFAAF